MRALGRLRTGEWVADCVYARVTCSPSAQPPGAQEIANNQPTGPPPPLSLPPLHAEEISKQKGIHKEPPPREEGDFNLGSFEKWSALPPDGQNSAQWLPQIEQNRIRLKEGCLPCL